MIFWQIACLIWSGNRISGQKAIPGPKNKVNWKIRNKLWVSNFRFSLQFSKFWKMRIQKSPNCMIFWLIARFRRPGSRISGQKAILEPKNKVNWKIRSKLWVSNFRFLLQFSKFRKMRIQKWPNCMIFGPIACFRRSGSRFSGQKGPRSSEMRVYMENTGHIKKS